jgi:hypothetical protein
MYSKGSHFLYIKVLSHNCVSQWYVIFIYIHLPETYTWYLYCDRYKSRHRWENNIEWVFGSAYSWSVGFFNGFEGKKVLMPDLEYRPYHVLFKYSQYSPVKDKIVFKKQIHHCSWGILRSLETFILALRELDLSSRPSPHIVNYKSFSCWH